MKKCFVLVLFFVGFLFTSATAQDPHFSQFYATPLNFNPALTGTTDGTFRINTIYRDQWTSALPDPIKTFSLGADLKFDMPGKSLQRKPDIIGLGIVFNSDKVNSFDLNSTSVSLLGAYHKSLDQRSNKYLTFGAMIGVVQRNINYEDLFFGDQFNTLDAYDQTTGEVLPANNFGYVDMAVGLNYSSSSSRRKTNVGMAFYHFNRPNVSFYKDENCPTCIVETESRLKTKLTFYGSVEFNLSETFALSPRVLAMMQGTHLEFDLGTNYIFKFPKRPGTAFHLGTWLRLVDSINSINVESAVFLVGLQKKNFLFGFSYDHNLTDLFSNRVGLNAFEFSLTYMGEHDNSFDICPKF